MKDATRAKTTRDAILDATDRLLARYGYKKMTIDDLAQEVGIGKGSVYLHFNSKEDIVLSHIDRIIERLKTKLDSLASGELDVDEKLRRMLCERVMVRFDSVQHYTQSLNDLLAFIRPKLLVRRERYFDQEARLLARVIEEGQRLGRYIPEDSLELAQTLVNATNSMLPFSLTGDELGKRKQLGKRVEDVATLLIRGLRQK